MKQHLPVAFGFVVDYAIYIAGFQASSALCMSLERVFRHGSVAWYRDSAFSKTLRLLYERQVAIFLKHDTVLSSVRGSEMVVQVEFEASRNTLKPAFLSYFFRGS